VTYRIGVDLGGTKIEAAVIDRAGEVLRRLRSPTPAGDYEETIAAMVALVNRLEEDFSCRMTVGVGIPGTPSSRTGLIKNANSTWIIGRPLERDLSDALGRPVRIANDANCFALSEAADGAAAGAASVFGVILGTGVGGGIVLDGRIVIGANAIAGEWGHNPLPWPRSEELPGPPCYCGRNGCIETYLSGPALAADHFRQTGEALKAEEIAAAADAGNTACKATLDCYADRLARALAHVINIVDPEVIVLGGGVSAITSLYTSVPSLWSGYVFSDEVLTKLVPPKHGDSSGVRGAAWLWRADETP
jgi:fructokinase